MLIFYYLALLFPWLPIIPGQAYHICYKGEAAQQAILTDPLVYHGLKRIGSIQIVLDDLPQLQSRLGDVSVRIVERSPRLITSRYPCLFSTEIATC